MPYRIVDENGTAVEPQVGYVDGYLFGERLLEGVRFKIEVAQNGRKAGELVCTGVHPDDAPYMKKFSKKQLLEWNEQALAGAEDTMTDEAGKRDLYWQEVEGNGADEKPGGHAQSRTTAP